MRPTGGGHTVGLQWAGVSVAVVVGRQSQLGSAGATFPRLRGRILDL